MKFMDSLLRMRLDGFRPGILRVAIGSNPQVMCTHEVWIDPAENLSALDLRPLYGLHLAVTLDLENSYGVLEYLDAILAIEPASVVALWTDSESGEGIFRCWTALAGWSDIPTAIAA